MTVNEEVEAFYAALGRAITQWAAVEYGLKETYHASLGNVTFWMCSAVFYAVDSFRAKLQMVDAAVKMATPQRLQDWQTLHARIEANTNPHNE